MSKIASKVKGENRIKIQFSYDVNVLEQVRTIPGRKYHFTDGKYWTCPYTKDNIRTLKGWGFEVASSLNFDPSEETVPGFRLIKEIKGFRKTLKNFQKEGVSQIDYWDGNALLADEMGLGKTIQVLAYLQFHPELRPAIIVCPAFLKYNWEKEIQECIDYKEIVILNGKNPKERDHTYKDIIILNYDILPNDTIKSKDLQTAIEIPNSGWVDPLCKLKAKILILDEAHYIKNYGALRTKAVKKLRKHVGKVIEITGTPIENRPIEIYTPVNIINPTLFPNRMAFGIRYCDGKRNRYGWDFKGSSHMDELFQRLKSTVMIRRLKKDVLSELPDKSYTYIPFKLSNQKEYLKAESDFKGYVKDKRGEIASKIALRAEALTKMSVLKQLAVAGVLKECIEWVEDFLECDKKIVVFCHHTEIVDKVYTAFKHKAVKVDGGVSPKRRHEAVERFQNDPEVKVFVGQIDAAGAGITLTKAHDVAFLELPWNPGKLRQAEDRVHRMTQEDKVTVYYLLAKNTIMEKMMRLLDDKAKVISQVLDGADVCSDELLLNLVDSYLKSI